MDIQDLIIFDLTIEYSDNLIPISIENAKNVTLQTVKFNFMKWREGNTFKNIQFLALDDFYIKNIDSIFKPTESAMFYFWNDY